MKMSELFPLVSVVPSLHIWSAVLLSPPEIQTADSFSFYAINLTETSSERVSKNSTAVCKCTRAVYDQVNGTIWCYTMQLR